MKKLYPLSLVLVLGVFVLAIVFAKGVLGAYADVPCMVVTWVPPILLALATHGARGFRRAFSVAYGADRASEADARVALGFFVALQRYLLVSGILGLMVGITAMLANLYDTASLGRGLALALLTVLYALVTMLVVTMPMRSALEKRLAEQSASQARAGAAAAR